MPSTVDIVNSALQLLGTRHITDLEESSKEARECSLAWPQIRDYCIRLHPWNCIASYHTFSPEAETPAMDWDYQYILPGDCEHVWSVDSADTDDWQVRGRRLFTDLAGPLTISYATEELDSAQFDAMLVRFMAHELAIATCESLVQSKTKKGDLEKARDKILAEAGISDGREQSNAEFIEDDWVLARFKR